MNRITRKPGAWSNVPLTFLLVMGVLLVALGWLGWLLLDQDRSLQHERTRNRVDSAANEISVALNQRTEELMESLEALSETMRGAAHTEIEELLQTQSGPGTVIYFAQDFILTAPPGSLRYSPAETTTAIIDEALAQADLLEFQQESPGQAIRQLKLLTESPDPSIQAGAHLRLGRIYNRQEDFERALEAYAHLAGFDGEYLENVPAPWLARYARCRIFAALHQEKAFEAELALLSDLITRGAGHVTKSTYRFYAESVNNWVRALPASGGASQKLYSTPGIRHLVPSWSPDSKEIAFAVGGGMMVISNGGGEPQVLASVQRWESWSIEWSPDGTQLAAFAYLENEPQNHIMLVARHNGEMTRLTPPSEDQYKEILDWHPSGKRISYMYYNKQDHNGSRVIELDGGQIKDIANLPDPMWDYTGNWGPDLRYYFISTERGMGNLWQLNSFDEKTGDYATVRKVKDQSVSIPTWSGDGRTMVWAETEPVRQMWMLTDF